MSSTYDPTNDTVSTITSGLLPLLIVGLYKGFEDDKKKPFSFINIFDDFIIFTSIIILPFILGVQWFQYFSDGNKTYFIAQCTISIIGGLSLYIGYITYYKSGSQFFFIIIVSNVFIFLPFFGHMMLISGGNNKDYISDYCKEYFMYNKCKVLRRTNYIVYLTAFTVNFLGALIKEVYSSFEWSKSDKLDKFNKIFRIVGIFCNHMVIISIIIYPAIISGWLLSTNSVTTKIAFGICSISLTRLIEHFNDNKLEKNNTIISLYLNQYKKKNKGPAEQKKALGREITEGIKQMADLTEDNKKIEQIKKIIKEIEELANETKEPMVGIEELAREICEKIKEMGKGINEIKGQLKEIYIRWLSKQTFLSPIEEKLVLKMLEVEGQAEKIEKELKNIGERIGGVGEEANEIREKISGIKEMEEKNEVRLTISQNNN